MTILRLLTSDRQLAEVCRDVVSRQLNNRVRLIEQSVLEERDEKDILFVDLSSFDFGESVLSQCEPGNTVLFVAREEILRNADAILGAGCPVILKPVSAVRVEMAIGQCLKRQRAESTEHLREHALIRSVLESNMQLQLYDQDRNSFLARAMHDFRTPLTSLEGYAGLLLDQQLGAISETQAAVLERMQQSIRRLSYLSDGVMNLSLGQSALRPLKVKPADIEQCIDQAVAEVSGAFADKRIILQVDVAPPPHALHFERSQIEQVIANLLDHAQKFSPKAGSVSIRAYPYFWDRRRELIPLAVGTSDRRQAVRNGINSYRIDITDSGPGLNEASLSTIFEEHGGLDRNEERSGAGLGLAICRLIVERHRGAIWVSSKEKGATFSIVLPCSFSSWETAQLMARRSTALARAATAEAN